MLEHLSPSNHNFEMENISVKVQYYKEIPVFSHS